MISLVDLYWTAGFLESRGNFGGNDMQPPTPVLRIRCKHAAPLERLKALYGGSVSRDGDTFYWRLMGKRVVGLAFTIWPLVSHDRRPQLEALIRLWYGEGPKKQKMSVKRKVSRDAMSSIDFWHDRCSK